jgi:hypothetical protein
MPYNVLMAGLAAADPRRMARSRSGALPARLVRGAGVSITAMIALVIGRYA